MSDSPQSKPKRRGDLAILSRENIRTVYQYLCHLGCEVRRLNAVYNRINYTLFIRGEAAHDRYDDGFRLFKPESPSHRAASAHGGGLQARLYSGLGLKAPTYLPQPTFRDSLYLQKQTAHSYTTSFNRFLYVSAIKSYI
jgi:hypothetical protein